MKRFIMVLLCFVPFFGVRSAEIKSGVTATHNVKAEKQIAALMQNMISAMIKSDIDTWSKNATDDFVGTYDEDTFTKQQLQDAIKSGEDVITSILNENVKIRIYGNTAIATGITILKEQYKGKDISGKSHFTNTFVKQNGRWLIASEHTSKIPAN